MTITSLAKEMEDGNDVETRPFFFRYQAPSISDSMKLDELDGAI